MCRILLVFTEFNEVLGTSLFFIQQMNYEKFNMNCIFVIVYLQF